MPGSGADQAGEIHDFSARKQEGGCRTRAQSAKKAKATTTIGTN